MPKQRPALCCAGAQKRLVMMIPTADEIAAKAGALAYGKPLIENSYRGLIVEIMIGEALGADWRHCSGDWRGWDFEHVEGCRLEVKQSAARQTWAAPAKLSPPSFDTPRADGSLRWRDLDSSRWTARAYLRVCLPSAPG
jgi:hypothetical protein